MSASMSDDVKAWKLVSGRYGKNARTMDLTTEEVFIMLHEVLAADAHLAPHGAKLEFFYAVANEHNSNTVFSAKFRGRSVRDRYERI